MNTISIDLVILIRKKTKYTKCVRLLVHSRYTETNESLLEVKSWNIITNKF